MSGASRSRSSAPEPSRAVGLELTPPLGLAVEERLAIARRIEIYLIDRRRNRRARDGPIRKTNGGPHTRPAAS